LGAPLALRLADDPGRSLDILEEEGVDPGRVLVQGLDRADHVAEGLPRRLAERGYRVGLDHVGWAPSSGFVDADTRIRLVLDLFDAGLGELVIVSSSAVGFPVELPAPVRDFMQVLREFVPAFRAAGGSEDRLTALLVTNPRRFLARAATEV